MLRTVVRQHIDHMISTRNFKARNERIETGVLVKSHEERNVSVEREKSGRMLSLESNWTVFEREPCSFNHGSYPDQGAQSPSSNSRTPIQTDGQKPKINDSPRGASPSGLKRRKPCKDFLKGKCTEPSCDLWHPPVCMNYQSESGCNYGDRCHFRETEAGGQPSKSQNKWRKRNSGLTEGDCSNGLCVP